MCTVSKKFTLEPKTNIKHRSLVSTGAFAPVNFKQRVHAPIHKWIPEFLCDKRVRKGLVYIGRGYYSQDLDWKVQDWKFTRKVFLTFHVTAVSSRERLLFKKNFFGPDKCGFYSREVTKRERLLMAQVW